MNTSPWCGSGIAYIVLIVSVPVIKQTSHKRHHPSVPWVGYKRRERDSTPCKPSPHDPRETPRIGKARRPVGSNDRTDMTFYRCATGPGISVMPVNSSLVNKENDNRLGGALTNATSSSSLTQSEKSEQILRGLKG